MEAITATDAALVALLLVAYSNVMALLSVRRRWDQWHAFAIGNTLLTLALLAYAAASGLLAAVWGDVSGRAIVIGVLAGAVPLAVILILMFLPGQLGRDIVASGIGDISTRQFVYRLTVQVALTTVVAEEFCFRGVLYLLLARSVPAAWAIGLNAIAFGLWHFVLQYNGFTSQRGLTRWLAAAGGVAVYALLGLLLALVRHATGGLLAPLLAHGVLDILMFAGMYVRRGQLTRGATILSSTNDGE